jgi:hypothetical protein
MYVCHRLIQRIIKKWGIRRLEERKDEQGRMESEERIMKK